MFSNSTTYGCWAVILSCDERLYVTLFELRNQSAFAVEIVMPMGEDPRHGILAALVVALVGLLLLIVAAFAVAPVLVIVLGVMTYVVWWYVSKEGTSYLHHAQVGFHDFDVSRQGAVRCDGRGFLRCRRRFAIPYPILQGEIRKASSQ